jgi:hypothetical protein
MGCTAHLRGEPVFEGALDLIAHDAAVLTRGAQLDVVVVRERHADHLAEEVRHACDVGAGELPPEARPYLLAPDLDPLVADDAGDPPEGRGDERIGRACAHRIAASNQELERRPRPRPPQELVPKA